MRDIEFELVGDYALFSDPLTRPGGEKNSLIVPTYEALRGAVRSCFWKPTIIWIIDQVRVMNPIRTETKGQLLINYSGLFIYDLQMRSSNLLSSHNILFREFYLRCIIIHYQMQIIERSPCLRIGDLRISRPCCYL